MEREGEDGDLENHLKRPREGKSSNEKGQQEGLVEDDPQCYTPSKQKRKIDPPTEANKNPATELADGAPENGAKPVKIDDSESDASSEDEEAPVVFNCPEPEFNDFDKDKAHSCFAIDQFWACYGNEDGMPRYYAHIRKVYSTGFKLRVMWLEPDPDNEDEIEWVDTELPVGSGKYRRGEYQDITDQFTFSHRIICEKGKKGFFFVYPRKGETWALFKDWNIKWSTEPEKHASYKFEIVEVLTDFVEGVGIRAVLLDKVRGFISLFYHGSQNRTGEFVIPPIELYRFSHRIPFFKMTGTERKGVPEGSFELDPASLPANPDDICYPSMFKMDNKTLGTRGNSLLPELSPGRSKSKMSETLVTPKKTDQCNGRRVSDGEGSALRRSPRGVNTGYKENKQVNASCVSSQSVAANNLNGKEGRSCNAEVSSQQDDSSPRRSDSISSSVSPSHTVALEQFHDFKSDRLPGKFEVGQIWALYETDNNLPKMYGQIKKVGVAYCILHVALFESCSVSKNGIKPACGAFKLISGKPRTFGSSSFSHLLDAKMINQYRFDVYPKAGQVWALYKNWKAEFTSADLENCEYDIVEVTRNSDGLINVTSLVPLKGYKSVFRSSRKSISSIGPMDIPENEMTRFSHQIPAFLLSTERGRALGGCWEVDPVSLLGKETCKKEFESSVKALSLRVEKIEAKEKEIEAKEKEIEAMDMRLVSKMEEFAGKEKEFDSKAVETRKKEENLERCRENLESKEKDLCLRTEKLEGKDKEIKAREIDLDSRKKELVVKGDDLERKGVEFRKQSENLETCKKKFEFMENDLSLRTGRLAAKEKQVEAREMVLSSREAELIVKQNADEKNAVEIRKKSENLEACRKEFESKEKEFEAQKMFLNSRTEELESKADEIRKKEENLERCRKNLESMEKDLCLRKERLEGKNKGIKAREIDLDSRKKELVVKGDYLERKGVEFRKQSENLETCKRKFEFEENDLSVRTGRLAAKEKQVEAREMVFSSRVAELIVKQNEIEKNAVEIRKKAENLHTCRKEFESKEKEFEARRMVLDSRTEEFESKADEIRKKEENLERCRENLESKEKDVCLRKEKLEGKDKGIKAREIDLDSRKKELVVKEDDLERKGVEFRKQSENLETCKKKFEFEENDLSLRIGRLAAKEKQVEAREMVFSSREAKLIVKQNEIEKNAVDIRKKSENVETCWKEFESKEKDLSLRTKKLGAKEKEIEGREMDLDSMMEELERKADEIRKKEEFLERCRTKIEYTKQALLLRREELEAKDKGIEAREVGSVSRMKELRAKEEELALRERYLNMKLNERNESANSVDDEGRACKLPKLDSADPRKRLEFRSKGKKRSRVCKDIDIVPFAPKEGTVCTNLAEMSLDKSKMHYSDPEFHDFDKGRKKSCLAVDQFWACYDQADAMPRFYMQIKKVYSKKFKVQITWLEVNPQYRCEVDAFVKDLPVACGKFISRNSEVILDPHTLSHQIHCEEDRNKGFYVIYPRKGEIWALYKDLHIKKKSNYEYEIVVVLSDFVEPTGIRVAYLNKLEGYVSLFQREKGSTSFLIRPNNLFKFSHQIPSYPLDGTESEGIPDGCFELDPACLPPECDGTSPPLVKTEQQQQQC